jgi:hypothetical protein
MKIKHFYGAILPIAAITGGYLAAYNVLIGPYVLATSYWRVILTAGLAVPIYALIAYFTFFSRDEVILLQGMLPWKKRSGTTT